MSNGRRISVLHAWGAGEGTDQLYVMIKDDALIQQIGWYEDDWEDTSITDLATLQTKAQEEFDRRKNPFTEAVVRVPASELPPDLTVGDIVTLIDSVSGTVNALPVQEISIDEDPDAGEVYTLGLNTQLVDLMDEIIRGRTLPTGIRPPARSPGQPAEPAKPRPAVPAPSNVRPYQILRGVGVKQDVPTGFAWAATEFHVSAVAGFTPDASTRVRADKAVDFEKADLTPGTRYYMRLRNIDEAGNVSAWSPEVSAVAGQTTSGDYGGGTVDTIHVVQDAITGMEILQVADAVGTGTTNSTWTDIPGFSVTFTIQYVGSTMFYMNTDVRVRSTSAETLPSGALRMVLDESPISETERWVTMNGGGTVPGGIVMTKSLSTGSHTLKGQFRTAGVDRDITVFARILGAEIFKR